jgi:hypothetical protein
VTRLTQSLTPSLQKLSLDSTTARDADGNTVSTLAQSHKEPSGSNDRFEPEVSSNKKSFEDMTQADVDGTLDLFGYYEEISETATSIWNSWHQYANSNTATVNAALTGNFGMHLVESITTHHALIERPAWNNY